VCQDGWTGMLCNLPNCYDYCAEGSECSVMDKHPYCKCGPGQFGTRCNQRIADYKFLRSKQTPKNRLMIIILPFVLLILAMTSVAYFAVLRRHG
jgi:hypothetical protein